MNILVIGHGGREHAIVHALKNSPSVNKVIAVPGNSGMSSGPHPEALCHNLDLSNIEMATKSLVELHQVHKFDFVFIGPEDPLVAGLSDGLRKNGIPVVGPSQAAAKLEGSKIFSKEFMNAAQIPTARFEIVNSVSQTLHAAPHFTPPYVLKADGLCAGKGVYIAKTLQDLESAARELFDDRIFGAAGERAVLEQYMPGWELSYLVITNAQEFECLPLAQDHKRLLDDDQGPNTGGMGTIAPIQILPKLDQQIREQIVRPTLQELRKRNFLYNGVLYFGLMITDQGPQLLEYNCRFGDPETQVILPLISNDCGLLFSRLARGKVDALTLNGKSSACVIMAAEGYPMNPVKGAKIEGDPTFSAKDSNSEQYFIHSGTKFTSDGWLTNGGRVLCAIGIGNSINEALKKAYEVTKKASWRNCQMRKDIGKKYI